MFIQKLMALGTLEASRVPLQVRSDLQYVLVVDRTAAAHAQTQPPPFYRRRYVGSHVVRLGLDGRYSQGAPVQGGRHQGGQRGTSRRAAILGPRVSRRPRARRRRTHGGGCSFNHKTIAAVGNELGPCANYG